MSTLRWLAWFESRCAPDNRFEGGTDEELLDLFKRNQRVLARSDEDVIAAMTRPR